MSTLRTGFEERAKVQRDFRQRKQEIHARAEALREERERKKLLHAMSEVDYGFTESDFDSALGKMVDLCYRFDRRMLGPAGWKAFEAASLTPSEFREMLKRTFGIHLTPQELGALVTYYDVSLAGVVSCFAFMNSFVQMRVKIDSLKVMIRLQLYDGCHDHCIDMHCCLGVCCVGLC